MPLTPIPRFHEDKFHEGRTLLTSPPKDKSLCLSSNSEIGISSTQYNLIFLNLSGTGFDLFPNSIPFIFCFFHLYHGAHENP